MFESAVDVWCSRVVQLQCNAVAMWCSRGVVLLLLLLSALLVLLLLMGCNDDMVIISIMIAKIMTIVSMLMMI